MLTILLQTYVGIERFLLLEELGVLIKRPDGREGALDFQQAEESIFSNYISLSFTLDPIFVWSAF